MAKSKHSTIISCREQLPGAATSLDKRKHTSVFLKPITYKPAPLCHHHASAPEAARAVGKTVKKVVKKKQSSVQ